MKQKVYNWPDKLESMPKDEANKRMDKIDAWVKENCPDDDKKLPINKRFEDLFKQYKEENPDWAKYLTDSTFYELMSWYDNGHGIDNEDAYSDEGREFANYIWDRYVEEDNWREDELDLAYINGRIDAEEQLKEDTVYGDVDFYEHGPIITLAGEELKKLVEKYNLKQDEKVCFKLIRKS